MSVTTATQAVPTGTWELDPVHSTIGFEIEYLVGIFRGRFDDVQAKLDTSHGAPALRGSATVDSVDVKDENLAAHLKSPEFFDAERHPQLLFESSEIDRAGDEVRVRGEITIKGISRPIELTGTLTEPCADALRRQRASRGRFDSGAARGDRRRGCCGSAPRSGDADRRCGLARLLGEGQLCRAGGYLPEVALDIGEVAAIAAP